MKKFGDNRPDKKAKSRYYTDEEGTLSLSTIDLVIVAGYAIALILIATLVSREKAGHEKDTQDYFLAGKALPWWAIGASLIAANISAEQIIGMSGSGYAIGMAIASYERTLVSNDAPYDRFVQGDERALNESQKRGMALFLSLGCRNCHSGPNFSGASLVGPKATYRPFLVDRSPRAVAHGLGEDKGKAGANSKVGIWRVPSLRNVALTAPYFHNGSVAGLSDAVRIMAATQLNALVGDEGEPPEVNVRWSPATRSLEISRRTRVTGRDIADLVAFLESLSGDRLASRARERQGSK